MVVALPIRTPGPLLKAICSLAFSGVGRSQDLFTLDPNVPDDKFRLNPCFVREISAWLLTR
jgi:hypothetical protein